MKTYFVKIIIFFTLISGYRVYGQSNSNEAHYKYGEIELGKFLEKKFEEDVKKNKPDVCLISAVFVKFTIDSVGNIKSLSFSETKGTPQVFRNILTSVIMATSGSWMPREINGKAVESKPFILPLLYDMEAGCNPQNVSTTNTYKPVPNALDTNLLYILDFEDNVGSNPSQLDCILLRPLHIFSQN